PNARERGLCCGGGGGHMWMEIKSEKRVNIIRTEELLATGARTVATACPFCLAMVDLGRKVVGAEGRLAGKDGSELVAGSLRGDRCCARCPKSCGSSCASPPTRSCRAPPRSRWPRPSSI